MDLNGAIAAHAEWKLKLRSAIAAKTQLDATKIGQDNQCPLGQWLHGEARTKYGALSAYSACLHAHADFHREAGRVARLINEKKYSEAEAVLGAGTTYSAASGTASVAINRLKKEAAL